MNAENLIRRAAFEAVRALYGVEDQAVVQVQKTRREFTGDFTLVVFPFLRASRLSPDATAMQIGEYVVGHSPEVGSFNVIKGFLNISLKPSFWGAAFKEIEADGEFGRAPSTGRSVMVEYSSPNTNKPLHLGHIRNNLLGWSVAEILRECGANVLKANLINDRGIHICKSMLAWKKFGAGETPASTGMKGDHLVGKYYVEFDKRYKSEIQQLMAAGATEEDAKKSAPMIVEAQEMLRKWEARDPETYALWETMNGWVYDGFEKTYDRLGVDFDRVYYESQTYLLGKALVEEGLEKGVFYRRPDGSVWIDLTADGLDEKLLLRADGTSVYMTQDLGTAYRRFTDEKLDALIYVVGNEQNYHFQVLKLVLKKLGYGAWADSIYHLSYGMVELPEGKMKSREGTVVDADDLVEGMVETAREMSAELGKLDGLTAEEAAGIAEMVGLGALKYFILKVDPRKTMLFDPRESIDFNGNTGPFIQYTYARIRSVLRKAVEAGIEWKANGEAVSDGEGAKDHTGEGATTRTDASASVSAETAANAAANGADGKVQANYLAEEVELIKALAEFPAVVAEAGGSYSPSVIAAYVYELAKSYNGFYHDHSIMREADPAARAFRLRLSEQVARVIDRGMGLLGITVPERM